MAVGNIFELIFRVSYTFSFVRLVNCFRRSGSSEAK